MTKPKQVSNEEKAQPTLVVEDSVVEVKQPAKPVTVTELPSGVVIEDY